MPLHLGPEGELLNAFNLLLHELRSPVSVAQGYLRLVLEDRLSDDQDRQQAIGKTMEALKRIGDICASAGQFANGAEPLPAIRYAAADLVSALRARARTDAVIVSVCGSRISGNVRTLTSELAAGAITSVVRAALRGDPSRAADMSVGVHGAEFIVTSGDSTIREQLVAAPRRHAFNQWQGGNDLLVPLAVKQLREAGAQIWTLADNASALGIAIPMELEV